MDILEAFQAKLKKMKKRGELDYYLCDESNVDEIEAVLEHLPWAPDLILLDIMIPLTGEGDKEARGGLILLARIKKGRYAKIPRDTRIVLISAIFDVDKVTQEYKSMIYSSLPKPFGIPQVTRLINDVSKKLRE